MKALKRLSLLIIVMAVSLGSWGYLVSSGPWLQAMTVAVAALVTYVWAAEKLDRRSPEWLVPLAEDPYGGPFGVRLKAERKRVGLEQGAAAERFGMKRTNLHLAESGIQPPSLGHLQAMRAAGINLRVVLLGEAEGGAAQNADALQQAAMWLRGEEFEGDIGRMANLLRGLLKE